ncbi:MAG: hypothetical protein Q9198_001175 [Flavoplaca austrocitrina]
MVRPSQVARLARRAALRDDGKDTSRVHHPGPKPRPSQMLRLALRAKKREEINASKYHTETDSNWRIEDYEEQTTTIVEDTFETEISPDDHHSSEALEHHVETAEESTGKGIGPASEVTYKHPKGKLVYQRKSWTQYIRRLLDQLG